MTGVGESRQTVLFMPDPSNGHGIPVGALHRSTSGKVRFVQARDLPSDVDIGGPAWGAVLRWGLESLASAQDFDGMTLGPHFRLEGAP